jgi:hypothetical protein
MTALKLSHYTTVNLTIYLLQGFHGITYPKVKNS